MAKKKYKVLDLFCGCGGISEGYALAGFDIAGGIDFNEYATITFQHNFKKAKVHNIDITTFPDSQIEEEYGDVDVIVGRRRWRIHETSCSLNIFDLFKRYILK